METGILKRIAELLLEKKDANTTFARNVSWSLANIMKQSDVSAHYFGEAV